ncbi:MAG: thioredoxin domain-containing protein [Pyrinomonadaceae bacterium]|nr:thioredoxin domain-containing protein [Pyrinomonadaceae bacterium]
MKISAFLVFLIFTLSAFAQTGTDVYATATGHTFKLADLSPEVIAAVNGLPANMAKLRTDLLEGMIGDALLAAEAKSQAITSEKLITSVTSKVAAPTAAAINKVYQANLAALDNKPLAEVRPSIVSYLKRDAQQRALIAYVGTLKTKYKAVKGMDVNAVNLKPTDILATIGAKTITAQQFEDANRIELFEAAADISDAVVDDLESRVLDTLINDEARSAGIEPTDYIAREITNKLKEYSDEERYALTDALQTRLFAKYKVNILYKQPQPLVEMISVDDDPAQGPSDAPVTVVMFSDFQCPACSATHPVLKKAMAAYPGKIRFVVRDLPLTNIHENAFNAALAAGAANAQGKFAEYGELLYQRQNALDVASLKAYAAELGLNVKQFEIDFSSEKIAAEVRKDMADAEQYRITSTPTIFINGIRVRRLSESGFRTAIERALAK